MSHVIYSVDIELRPPLVRCPSEEEKQKDKDLYPYLYVGALVKETYICPFCGNTLKEFHCNCEEFQTAFKKLQEFNKDFKHKSKLHYPEFHVNIAYRKDIKGIDVRKLGKEDISKLGPDFWDDATKVHDRECDYSYLVKNGEYKDNKITFICKDIQTKKVYQCTIDDIIFTGMKINLGVWRRKTVSDGAFDGEIRCGNYHFEDGYEDIVTFENWEQFCKILLAM